MVLNFPHSDRLPCAIFGANGYSGMELARLLLRHPRARLTACISRRPNWKLSDELLDSGADQVATLSIEEFQNRTSDFHTVFLATPAEVSLEWVPQLLKRGLQVIDLSGAFRLNPEDFQKWYRLPHSCPELLSQAHYGISPWSKPLNPAQLVSNPGCYATSILMALIPLIRDQVIDPNVIAIDAKSGTSGAGLKASENLLFNEVDCDCTPYRVGCHQHLPEIIGHLKQLTGVRIDPHFSTSLLPIRRGIISSLFLRPHEKLGNKSDTELQSLIEQSYQHAYRNYSLVRSSPLGQSSAQDKLLLSLKKVAGSPRTHLSYTVQDGKIYVFSLIDNLLKGASSQAIENWNRINGFSIETGLTQVEGQL